jgi:hypothetical protein
MGAGDEGHISSLANWSGDGRHNRRRDRRVSDARPASATQFAGQPLRFGGSDPSWTWKSDTCQRAPSVANNVIIDVSTCSLKRSDAQSDSAVNIAHQIAAKVPTTWRQPSPFRWPLEAVNRPGMSGDSDVPRVCWSRFA